MFKIGPKMTKFDSKILKRRQIDHKTSKKIKIKLALISFSTPTHSQEKFKSQLKINPTVPLALILNLLKIELA